MVQKSSLGRGIFRKLSMHVIDNGEELLAIDVKRFTRDKNDRHEIKDDINRQRFKRIEENTVIEDGTRIFNTENISMGNEIYIGHDCYINGYHEGSGLEIGDNCWIGPGCYIHAAGGIKIGKNTGIGPHVKMLTSYHSMRQTGKPVIENDVVFRGIEIGENCDIGMGVMLMPGAKIANDCIVEAGVVIKEDFSNWDMSIIKNTNGIVDHRQLRR